MPEYIERETVIDAVESTDWYHISMQGNLVHGAISDGNALYKADDIFKVLVDAPAADVAPVVHGRWDFVDQDFYDGCFVDIYICTSCGTSNDRKSAYCPNCGARMRGAEDE
jgi:hypothetical protein